MAQIVVTPDIVGRVVFGLIGAVIFVSFLGKALVRLTRYHLDRAPKPTIRKEK